MRWIGMPFKDACCTSYPLDNSQAHQESEEICLEKERGVYGEHFLFEASRSHCGHIEGALMLGICIMWDRLRIQCVGRKRPPVALLDIRLDLQKPCGAVEMSNTAGATDAGGQTFHNHEDVKFHVSRTHCI